MSAGGRIKPDEVREIALLARLDLSETEVARMTSDLDAILGYVETLREVSTEGVLPMTHAVPFDCPLRPDETHAALSVDEALANAPRREASFFQVPRMIARPGAAGGADGGVGAVGDGGSEDEP